MRNAIFSTACLVVECLTGIAQQNYGLDLSFASKGWRFTSVVSQSETRTARLEIQVDGKSIAVGSAKTDKKFDFAIARHNIDGSLDINFGTNGKVLTDFDSSWDIASDVKIRNDSKILVVGSTGAEHHPCLALCRYLSSGLIDSTFGNKGKISFTNLHIEDARMQLSPDENIVISGRMRDSINGYNYLAIVRLTGEGALDPTWGNNGLVLADYGHTIGSTAIAVQNDGRIIVAGNASKGSNPEVSFSFFGKYLNEGQLDPSFANGGTVTVSQLRFSDLAIQEDEKMVAVGTSYQSQSCFAVCRLKTNGAIDSSFNSSGFQQTCLDAMSSWAVAVKIQKNGGILVAGGKLNPDIAVDFALVRFNSDGSIDENCLKGGIQTFNFPDENIDNNNAHWPVDMKLQTDGKPVVLGSPFLMFDKFVLARYTVDSSVEIKEISYGDSFHSFYNSTKNEIFINGPAAKIYVVDATGRQLYQGAKENGNLSMDASSYLPGVYIILSNSQNSLSRRKIVIER